MNSIHDVANRYVSYGLSILPVKTDGSKAPESLSEWKSLQKRQPNGTELAKWFCNATPCGVAVICGAISGHLEVIDFDDPTLLNGWLELIKQVGAHDLAKRLMSVKSPGGYHLYYRCPERVEGNQKLARRKRADGKVETLIETKGEGGYVIAPGSPIECHPDKLPYELLSGSFNDIPIISSAERAVLLDCARALNEHFDERDVVHGFDTWRPHTTSNAGNRPGDDFNFRAEWQDILSSAGWTLVKQFGGEGYWRKPGDTKPGHHATTNHAGNNLFHVFSTSAAPFEAGTAYTKFAAFALLNHRGDFLGAARELARQGYGVKPSDSHNGICNDAVSHRTDEVSPLVPAWPRLDSAALTGLIGEFVTTAAENSEADPAAILFNLLPFLGCIIGPDSFVEIGDDKHPARLFTLTVGATGRGRKGTAAAPVKKLAKLLPAPLAVRITPGPLSSGEGLIHAVRDGSDKVDKDGNSVDPGVTDKRLFVLSSEFASALAAMKRDGNTLGTTMRAAFDDGDLDPLTKNNIERATGAHICITSHITREELLKKLDDIEIYSGTMNRFLLGCVRRSKHVPSPKPLDETWLKDFAKRLTERLFRARILGPVSLTMEAAKLWNELYHLLTKDEPGIVGAVISRSEALAKRVAQLYALCDDWHGKPIIDTEHLRSSMAIIDYSRESARFIYGTPGANKERDELCQRILKAIKSAPNGLTQTELHEALNRNVDATKLWSALEHLQAVGRLTQSKTKTQGRSRITWAQTDGFNLDIDEVNENDEEIY